MIVSRVVLVLLLLLLVFNVSVLCKSPLKKAALKSHKKASNKKDGFESRRSSKESEPSTLSVTMEKLTDFIKYEASVARSVAKSALDMISVKHVSYLQVLGKWKIYQDVKLGDEEDVLSYPVSIELHENGTVTTKRNGEVQQSSFKFTERQWPQKCSIEFELSTYDAQTGATTAPLLYKGYFKRSLLNNFIVIMKGSLYKTTGKSFWKQTQKVGRFKATKRRYA